MDLLDYGMKYENSDFVLSRTLAKAALVIEEKKADMYEAYLNRKNIEIPEDPEADAVLYQKILDRIAEHY